MRWMRRRVKATRRSCGLWAGIMRAMRVPPSVAGRIGRALVEHLAARRYPLSLVDRPGSGLEAMAALGAVVELDLADQPPAGLFDGVEVVVHLAGEASQDASWDSLLPDNIEAS